MKKLHWFIILIAILILLLVIWFLKTGDKGIVSVNCQTDSLSDIIRDKVVAQDTVVLMGDCQEDDSVVIDKDITLDGQGNTLSGTSAKDVIVVDNATVTIKNITVTRGKHGVVSKNSIVFSENLIVRDNNGVGIIVVGEAMGENEYNDVLDSMNKIDSSPVNFNNNKLFRLKSSNNSSKIISVCSLSQAELNAASLPVLKMTCGEVYNNNSGGIFIADDTKGCFGYGGNCTIEVFNNPWGVYARGANMDVGDGLLSIHHNNSFGVGLALKGSVLTGNGEGTASMHDQTYNFCKQRDDDTNILADRIHLEPSVSECPFNLP